MTSKLTYKITKAFQLVSAFTVEPVFVALGPFGLDAAEIERGRHIVEEAQRASAMPTPQVVRSDAWKGVVTWGRTWLAVGAAALQSAHPNVFDETFAGIENPGRTEMPAAVHIFATRVLALAASDAEESKLAWERLSKRGFNVAMLEAVRDEIMKKESFQMGDPVAREAREKAINAAWEFYLEWSKIARTRIKDKRVRLLMGIRNVKVATATDTEEPAAPPVATPASPAPGGEHS